MSHSVDHTVNGAASAQTDWRFDGTRLLVPGLAVTVDEATARRLFREHCTREGKDPASPSTPVRHLDMSGKTATQITTFGEEEFIHWKVELEKLRRSSSKIRTRRHEQVWLEAAKAFKEKWSDRCPPDVKVTLVSYSEHLRS